MTTYVDGQTCFGLDKLILNNNYADATNMKEALIYDMYQYLGADASLYNYAKLSVNGEYWGVYLALEAVEDSFLLRNYGVQDGELYKPDSMNIGGGKDFGDFNADNIDFGDLDLDNLLRYMAVHIFSVNEDSLSGSMAHNYYLYEEDGVLSMIPWDYNLAFGGFLGGSDATSVVNDPIDSPVSSGSTEDRPMVAWIFQEETYTQQYHALYDQFITTYFESGAFETEFDQVSAMIAPYVERDPTKFCTYDEFETGVSTLKAFCQLRAQSIRGQLDGTIPSTTDGQQADDSALVDVSSLSISDMGEGMEGAQAIGGMGPMGGDQGREERQPPGRSDSTQEREASQSEGEKPTEQEEGGIEQGR